MWFLAHHFHTVNCEHVGHLSTEIRLIATVAETVSSSDDEALLSRDETHAIV